MKKVAGLLLFALFASFSVAQGSTSMTELLVKHWQTSKEFTLAVVDKMPDSQFSFKATSGEMSFGQMASHIADANMSYCSGALGSKPGPHGTDFSKEAVTKRITDSFDFCIAGLQKMSEADLMQTKGEGARKATSFELFWGAFTHTAHHRAALEVYLRLKDIVPPQYKF